VSAVADDRRGFDVLVPDDEFEQLREWVDGGAFDEHDVYHVESGIHFAMVVLKGADASRAVCCPLYYDADGFERLRENATRAGRLYTYVRNPAEESVTYAHEEPELFVPDEAE